MYEFNFFIVYSFIFIIEIEKKSPCVLLLILFSRLIKNTESNSLTTDDKGSNEVADLLLRPLRTLLFFLSFSLLF